MSNKIMTAEQYNKMKDEYKAAMKLDIMLTSESLEWSEAYFKEFEFGYPQEQSNTATLKWADEEDEEALSISEIKSLLDKEDWSKEDIATLLNSQKRQVKWLFNNSNKMTIVYEEKFVRLLIHKISNHK